MESTAPTVVLTAAAIGGIALLALFLSILYVMYRHVHNLNEAIKVIWKSSTMRLLRIVEAGAIVAAIALFFFEMKDRPADRDVRKQTLISLAFERIEKAEGAGGDVGQYAALKFLPSLTGEDKIDIHGIDLSNKWFAGIDLAGAFLSRADFQGADLLRAKLQGATLSSANLQGANLLRTKLQGADLSGAKFQGANLANANLRDSVLGGANFQSSNLYLANLRGVDLRGVNCLTKAQLDGAKIDEDTVLPEFPTDCPKDEENGGELDATE